MYSTFVNRKFPHEVYKVLNSMSKVIDNYVDYCGYIHDKLIEEVPFGEYELPIPLLFGQIINTVDSISLLTQKGQTNGVRPLLRMLIESRLTLMYLLDQDIERGCKAYIVSHVQKEISTRRLFDQSEEKGKRLSSQLKEMFDLDANHESYPKKPINESAKHLFALLDKEEMYDVTQEWIRTKKEKRNRVPEWYSLYNGPNNLRELAQYFKEEPTYDVMYQTLSSYIHGGAALKTLRVAEDNESVIPVFRDIEGLQTLVTWTINLISDLVLRMLEKYLPELKQHYADWYTKEVRKVHLKIAGTKLYKTVYKSH
ncbi:DUF5677 domain-containing protein [Paenibacillus terrigena]|uniref:DUF5677 domain-containing protein n=1 Tax=Paenibacillus terrigena TaxID=369333 RepID=UPI0003623AF9|nr:DUF5677 domain-containing protein [Paenibacillus terrigena]